MLSFKDFLAVQYTGGESEQQDLNAKKRHRGVVGEDAGYDAAHPLNVRRQSDIHKDYTDLKSRSTADVHKIHQSQRRVTSKYTPAEVGGKQGMIADILRNRHGDRHVSHYFGANK